MFDPAAIATLRIGLDAIDADGGDRRPRRRRQRRDVPSTRTSLRSRTAHGLRRLADAIEPRTPRSATRTMAG